MRVKMILPALTEATSRSGCASSAHDHLMASVRHLAYAAGWKKFEPLWDVIIRARRTAMMLPVLETVLSEFGRRSPPLVRDTQAGTSVEEDQGDIVQAPPPQLIEIQPRRASM